MLTVVEDYEHVPVNQRLDELCRSGTDCSMIPSVLATASATASGSLSLASSTNHTPSPDPSSRSAATCNPRRVFPTPPGPTRVTSRDASTRPRTSATSVLSPTKLDTSSGRLLGIPGLSLSRPHWRKVGLQTFHHELEDVLGPAQVLQAMDAQGTEDHASREDVVHHVGRGPGKQDLAAMAHGPESVDPVERGPEVVAVPFLAFSGVHGHPDSQGGFFGPHLGPQCRLGHRRRLYRLLDGGEHRGEGIADGFEDVAPRLLDGRAHQLVVSS